MARICIIEDDPSFASALERLMRPLHEVSRYDSAPKDPEAILASKPHIIFLDAMLPEQASTALLARLRSDERVQSSALILLSGHHEMLKEANQLEDEREEFLKKPCTVRQIMAAVQRHLRRLELE